MNEKIKKLFSACTKDAYEDGVKEGEKQTVEKIINRIKRWAEEDDYLEPESLIEILEREFKIDSE